MPPDLPALSLAPPAPPAPVICLFCLQVVADEGDGDLVERLQAHACPEGEQA